MFNSFLLPRSLSGINPIKSVQQGAGTFPTSTTLNVDINSVDITKSIVLTHPFGGTNINVSLTSGLLTSPIIAQFSTFAAGSGVFTYEIIEFGTIKSFQSGTIAVTASANQTINAVSIEKSLLFYNFAATGSSTNLIDSFMGGFLSSKTNVNLQARGAATLSANWYVVEFY